MDEVRAYREMLKKQWFSIPKDENKVEFKAIVIKSNKLKDWFIVKIITDVIGYYSSSSCGFNTMNEALEYAKKRNKENDGVNDYTKYKLIIKQL